MEYSTVSVKGGVVIPAHIRTKYKLKPGTRLQFVEYGGILALVPVPANPIRTARGLLKGKSSLTRILLAEHAKEREHDKRRIV